MEIRKNTEQTRSTDRVHAAKAVPDAAKGDLRPHAETLEESREATRQVRHELERARENGDPTRRDRIDLSQGAAAQVRMDLEGEQARAGLVEALREAYNNGSLATSERIESAARRLLGERI